MTPADMEGMTIGPVTHVVDRERIAFFVDASGDDAKRWVEVAPPGYAAVLLFRVAGDFLWDERIAEYVTTLIHVDQSFSYPSPLYAGDEVVITGSVDRVRERSGAYFVTFTAGATVGDRAVLESRSTFLMSDQPAGEAGADQGEPGAEERANNELPARQDVIARSASRADLVRYAAATADFNPLHWDHASARAAGLEGVVTHGLLLNAWLSQHAGAFSTEEAPIVAIKARFRSALRPGAAAATEATVDGETVSLRLSAGDATIVTAQATIRGVTP
jgi:acyl dehydratase